MLGSQWWVEGGLSPLGERLNRNEKCPSVLLSHESAWYNSNRRWKSGHFITGRTLTDQPNVLMSQGTDLERVRSQFKVPELALEGA